MTVSMEMRRSQCATPSVPSLCVYTAGKRLFVTASRRFTANSSSGSRVQNGGDSIGCRHWAAEKDKRREEMCKESSRDELGKILTVQVSTGKRRGRVE